jgi:hypothetical protein
MLSRMLLASWFYVALGTTWHYVVEIRGGNDLNRFILRLRCFLPSWSFLIIP